MKPAQQIRQAIVEAQCAADAACGVANALSGLILQHRPDLASDATIPQEAATLLQHAAQNFGRIAAKALEAEESKGKRSHR